METVQVSVDSCVAKMKKKMPLHMGYEITMCLQSTRLRSKFWAGSDVEICEAMSACLQSRNAFKFF